MPSDLTPAEQADPEKVLPIGFAAPHSYRGNYYDVAFELRRNITVIEVLDAAASAVDETFQGWKGGDFTMSEHTYAWLVAEEGDCGELIGAVLMELLLSQTEATR